jgi:hypothetical protein
VLNQQRHPAPSAALRALPSRRQLLLPKQRISEFSSSAALKICLGLYHGRKGHANTLGKTNV